MNQKSRFTEPAKIMIISIFSGVGIWLLGIATVSIMVLNKIISLRQAGYAGILTMIISAFIMSAIVYKKIAKNKIVYVIIGTAVIWLIMFLFSKIIGSGCYFLGAILPLLSGSAASVIILSKPKKNTKINYNKIAKW